MKNTVLLAGLLAAWPLLAQTPPAQNPPAQNPPAPSPPALEKPQMETPEPADSKAPDSKPADTKAAAPKKAEAPAAAAKTPKKTTEGEGKVVEEIIARVNNEIITRSEYEKSRATAAESAQEDCKGRCTPEQVQVAVEDAQKFALRDLIDQSLLAQRGKDMGISVEPDVVKQLDQIRIQNKLKDLDELEKAVSSQPGMNWDDFKNNIRNRLLTQEVIRHEVGSHITIGDDDAKKYYEEHKKEYVMQEQVALSAMEVKTEGKKESEIADLKAKAVKMRERVKDGEDFGELAKRFSDGSTAQQDGFLGVYKHGELSKELEDTVFSMKKNEMTDVIETKQGFLVLKVLEHYAEGEQPYDKVKNKIMDLLYSEKMEPALREYLKTLREQSYVVIKPGFQEMAGGGNSEIEEVSTTPEETKEKKGHKKYLLFGKRTGSKS